MVFAGLFGSYFSEMYPIRPRMLEAGFCFNVGGGLAAFAAVLLGGIASFYSLAVGLMICAGFYAIFAAFVISMPRNKTMGEMSTQLPLQTWSRRLSGDLLRGGQCLGSIDTGHFF